MTHWILILLASHCLADFLLQPDALVERKRNGRFLLLHGLIHAAVAYLAIQNWGLWLLPVTLFAVHTLIDGLKQRFRDTAQAFLVDQVVHAASLAFLGWWMTRMTPGPSAPDPLGAQAVILLGGLVATVQGAAFGIGKFMEARWPEDPAMSGRSFVQISG